MNIENWFSLIAVVSGGGFGLFQWYKSNVYKRTEIVRDLIITTRDDEDIAAVMDIIDWDNGFFYDGIFHITNCEQTALNGITDQDFFHKIDKTLSHFSYICYLSRKKTIDADDMSMFEYSIRRLMDNVHIQNYLYSLYHWSSYLKTSTSFSFLIQYGLKQKYLYSSFKNLPSVDYTCYLEIPQSTR